MPRPWPACRCCPASGARTRSWPPWLRQSHAGDPYGNYFLVLLIVAVATALLTAFYTFRAYFLTFWGAERFPDEAGHHPHESPPVMSVPLVVLAVVRPGHRRGRRPDGLVRALPGGDARADAAAKSTPGVGADAAGDGGGGASALPGRGWLTSAVPVCRGVRPRFGGRPTTGR